MSFLESWEAMGAVVGLLMLVPQTFKLGRNYQIGALVGFVIVAAFIVFFGNDKGVSSPAAIALHPFVESRLVVPEGPRTELADPPGQEASGSSKTIVQQHSRSAYTAKPAYSNPKVQTCVTFQHQRTTTRRELPASIEYQQATESIHAEQAIKGPPAEPLQAPPPSAGVAHALQQPEVKSMLPRSSSSEATTGNWHGMGDSSTAGYRDSQGQSDLIIGFTLGPRIISGGDETCRPTMSVGCIRIVTEHRQEFSADEMQRHLNLSRVNVFKQSSWLASSLRQRRNTYLDSLSIPGTLQLRPGKYTLRAGESFIDVNVLGNVTQQIIVSAVSKKSSINYISDEERKKYPSYYPAPESPLATSSQIEQ